MKILTLLALLASQLAFAGSYSYHVTLSPLRYNEEHGYYAKVYVRNKEDEATQNVRIQFRLYQDEDFAPIEYDSQPCFATIGNKPYDVFPDYAGNLDENTGDFIIPELKPHEEFNFAVVWTEKIPIIYGVVRVLDDNDGFGSVEWPHHEISTTVKDAVSGERALLIKLDYQGEHSCFITSS